MEDIFYFQILDYIDDFTFKKSFFIISKHDSIQTRVKKLLKYDSAKLLFKRMPKFDDVQNENWQIYIETPRDYCELLNDYIEMLLNEVSLERAHMRFINRRFIKTKKYHVSNTIFFYKTPQLMLEKIIHDNQYEVDYKFYHNISLCATYRLPCLQASILTKHYPLAKALIY